MGQGVSFIHLSDIHFRKYSGDKFDVDEDLRNEIIRDIKNNAKANLKNIGGILICGDIAFSGQESEYERAHEFLKEICNILSIPYTSVYCVPGNHDVDQTVPYRGSVLYTIQKELEKAETSVEIDATLAGYNRDTSSRDTLYKHIEKYNTKFAARFNCNINSESPNWQADFQLDCKSTLRLYGLNSVIISNKEDHKDKLNDKLMVLGKYQIPKREDGIVYMSLCHHPPECWKDYSDELKNLINKRIQIQLYGHKHVQEVTQINDESLIIGSGATHPSRFEDGWNPRYNWINVEVINVNDRKCLKTKIYQRVLNSQEDKFIADVCEDSIQGFNEYILNLEKDTSISEEEIVITETKNVKEETSISEINSLVKQINIDTKTIAYRFVELPFVTQTVILSRYGLIEEDFQGKKYVDVIDKIVEKAKNVGCLNELWRDINKYLGVNLNE